jgi:hypothetical protein
MSKEHAATLAQQMHLAEDVSSEAQAEAQQSATAAIGAAAASCARQATKLQLEFHLDENEIAELQRDFEDIDHDGSGLIDAAEVAQLLTKERAGQRGWFSHPTAEEVQQTVEQYDQNRDSQITFREYVTTLCGLSFVTAASNSHNSADAEVEAENEAEPEVEADADEEAEVEIKWPDLQAGSPACSALSPSCRPTALDLPPQGGSLDLPEFFDGFDDPNSPVSPPSVSDNSSQRLASAGSSCAPSPETVHRGHRLLEAGFTQPIVSPPLPSCAQKRRRAQAKAAVGVTGVRTSSCFVPSTVWRNARYCSCCTDVWSWG